MIHRVLLFKFCPNYSTTFTRNALAHKAILRLLVCHALFCTASATDYAPVITIDDGLVGVSSHDRCQWYTQYPYNDAGDSVVPSACMSANDCTMFNTNACSRHGAAAYATVARFPRAFHLNHDFVNILGLGSGLQGWHRYERDASQPWPDAHVPVDVTSDQRQYWKKIDSAAHDDNLCLYDLFSSENGDLDYSACLRVEDIQALISDVTFADSVSCASCYSGSHNVAPAADCLGIPGMRGDDGVLCNSGNGGRHTACLINAQSVSMRICQLDKVCINKQWVEAQDPPLVEAYTQSEDGGIVFKINNVVLKTPQTDDAFFRIYEDNVECSGTATRDVSQYSGSSSGAATLDLNRQSAMLMIRAPYTCSCQESATEQGDNLRYDLYDTASGLHRCMECQEPAANSYLGYYRGPDSTQARATCFPQISALKCLQCPTNEYYNPTTKRCEACPAAQPKRNNFVDNPGEAGYEKHCTTCSAGQWFNTDLSPAQCQPVETIQLLPGGTLSQEDHYRHTKTDNTINGYTAVEFGSFLQINQNQEYNKVECSSVCEDEFQFPQWCGAHEQTPPPAGHRSRDVYLQRETAGTIELGLWSSVHSAWSTYTILRRGKCTDCNACVLHNYNTDCGVDLVSAGECAPCKDPSQTDLTSCNADQYFNHTSELGCVQTKARSDYTCENCKYADYDAETDTAQLWIGCGLRDSVQWWTAQGTAQTCTYATPGATDCAWTDRSDDTVHSFSNNRNEPLPAAETESIPFLGIRGQGLKIPYCPPNFHVKQECVDAPESFSTSPYQAECCAPCLAQPDGSRRTAAYVACTGYTVQDTQAAGYTNDCPAQTYTDENSTPSDFNDDTCETCTTCPGQFIV